MQLHQIKPKNKLKKRKRIGRGGKRGTYSGKGMKGQKSRAGHKIRPAERDLIQRLPKLRGFKNKSLLSKTLAINLKDIEKKIDGGLVNKEVLIKAGLMRKSEKRVKILGSGDIKKSFQIEKIEVSKSAKEKIEAAGGKVL